MSTRQWGRGEPIFNLPGVVTILIVIMIGIHAIRFVLLTDERDELVLGLFAFAPDRYVSGSTDGLAWPGGIAAMIWSPFTYALLHNDLLHLISNCTVFAALGNVLGRRMSAIRFLAFCIVMAPVSALGEVIIAVYQSAPVIGVSGVICAMLGGLARFIFPEPVAQDAADDEGFVERTADSDDPPNLHPQPVGRRRSLPPALEVSPILETLQRPKVIQFILGFAVLNLMLVVAAPVLVGGGAGVAWMVHLAGFVAGFVLYPSFESPLARK